MAANENNSSPLLPYDATSGSPSGSAVPGTVPLSPADHFLLQDRYGLAPETIRAAQLFTIRDQPHLDQLGAVISFSELPSTIAIPYPSNGHGATLWRMLGQSLPGMLYPLYNASLSNKQPTAIVTDDELRALVLSQRGHRALALPGLQSHLRRVAEMADQLKATGVQKAILLFETDREKDGAAEVTRDSTSLALAYAFALEKRGLEVAIARLPEKYLTATAAEDGDAYLKTDIADAFLKGLSPEEFKECLEKAVSFWAYPAPAHVKAVAMWRAEREGTLDRLEDIKRLLEREPAVMVHRTIAELASWCRGACYDTNSAEYSKVLTDSISRKLYKAVKDILPGMRLASVRQMVETAKGTRESNEGPKPMSLADFRLDVQDGKVYRTGSHGQGRTLVCNFVPKHVRTGHISYLGGKLFPLHEVDMEFGKMAEEITVRIYGSLFDPEAYSHASGGKLVVNRAQDFRTLMAYLIDDEEILALDEQLNRTLYVGIVEDHLGHYVVSDGVEFPGGTEECPYAGKRFNRTGDMRFFERAAKLTTNGVSEIIMVATLGAPIKAATKRWPNTGGEGDTTSGKSTLLERVLNPLGITSFGPSHCRTAYRIRKMVINTNLPVALDEAGRLGRSMRHILVDVLNEGYGITPSTHGEGQRMCVISAPVILFGQDLPFNDLALSTKIIKVTLDPACRDPKALEALMASESSFPTRRWLEFLAEYMSTHDVNREIHERTEVMRERVFGTGVPPAANAERFIWNWAAVSYAGDILVAFGAPVSDAFQVNLVNAAKAHADELYGEMDGRHSIGRRVVHDVMELLATPDFKPPFSLLLDDRGLFFHVEGALRYLESKGYRYDVSNARVVTHLLRELGTPGHRERVGNVQIRLFHVPAEALRALGYDMPDSGRVPGNTAQ